MSQKKPEGFAETQRPYEKERDDPKTVGHTRLKIDQAGRLVIPAHMRAAMLVKPGDTVTAEVIDGEFRIVSPGVALRRVQAFAREFRASNRDTSVVDELIAERRAEARRELEEANEWRAAHGLPPLE
jgi:bifunctional DNA-binding transcriptional regulator/antitoxin component of YhaV-PrlF toxin-antitoxin module